MTEMTIGDTTYGAPSDGSNPDKIVYVTDNGSVTYVPELTCKPIEQYLDLHSDLTVTVCSNCGVPSDDLEDCNFCSNCGARVVIA